MSATSTAPLPEAVAQSVRAALPSEGLFAGETWRCATQPFALGEDVIGRVDKLGRIFLQFYRALNLLYRQSVDGKQPAWVADWLERGKPADLIELQRSSALKGELPRVIRPDLLITENGFAASELDSVPGGVGLTGWLNQSYAQAGFAVLGGANGMIEGFRGIFGDAKKVHLMVSEESATYRPEMRWLAAQLGDRFQVVNTSFTDIKEGEAVYRFFEMFDLANISAAKTLFSLAQEKQIRLTPPPKTFLEEKLTLALLWNRNLRPFWLQQLGESFFKQLLQIVPYTWIIDPAPLPPNGAFPELNLTDWTQLKTLSQKERDLILKVSGFSENAWGARGVSLGSDMSVADWSAAVDQAINSAEKNPFILQRYHKPKTVEAKWFDFKTNAVHVMNGRVRLCPYYFVHGDGDAARTHLGGALATICPADKKIIHGMDDAILAPCMA
ncbi:MAG: hypothetical protein K0Q55_3196 [Verrucomicrobia bacterium]|jgi:hypothetical protein|nr:hypothetical protein [Verrucomicrobiota bacterium]